MPLAMQTAAQRAVKPGGCEEVRISMPPGRRAEIEALAEHLHMSPWVVVGQAIDHYWQRYGHLARTQEAAHLPVPPKPADQADSAETVVLWIAPGHRAYAQALAAAMKMPLSLMISVALGQWFQTLGPERQAVLQQARGRASSAGERRVSLDARQHSLAEALAIINEIAAHHEPAAFPVSRRIAGQLDEACAWLNALRELA